MIGSWGIEGERKHRIHLGLHTILPAMKDCVGGGARMYIKYEKLEPELLAMVSGMNEHTALIIFLY